MATPLCFTLTAGIATANCLGIEKPGGVYDKVYIGYRPDIATMTVGTNGEITALTLKASKKLFPFASKKYVHDAKGSLVVQQNRNMFKHIFVGKLFPYTQSEWKSLEELLISKRMFIIYPTQAGQVKTLGLDVNPYVSDIDDERGLAPTGSDWLEGINFADEGSITVTLEGDMFGMPKIYKPSETFAANIAALDLLCA